MTWIPRGNRNLTITNSNSTGTFMSYATDQLPSTAKSMSYKVHSSLGSHIPANLSPPTPLQLESMDKKILKWGRQILRLTPTFPTAVLSGRHLLQLPMPSDAI